MRILFDNGMPNGLRSLLAGHEVTLARELGWSELSNGKLLRTAEDAGFEAMFTTDNRIKGQQNLSGRRLALVVLSGSSKWARVQLCLEQIQTALAEIQAGDYREIFIPFQPRPSELRKRH